jgi:hypothetical protein
VIITRRDIFNETLIPYLPAHGGEMIDNVPYHAICQQNQEQKM